jgi:hypothetical protein
VRLPRSPILKACIQEHYPFVPNIDDEAIPNVKESTCTALVVIERTLPGASF